MILMVMVGAHQPQANFNTTAKHSYNVGEDFNHQLPGTQNYVKRVIKQWIQEYKIGISLGFNQRVYTKLYGIALTDISKIE
jgi:hypothetical protein